MLILQSVMWAVDLLKVTPRRPTAVELEQYAMLLKRFFTCGGVLSVGDAMALNCLVQRHTTLFREFDLPRGDMKLGSYEYELTQTKLSLMRAAIARAGD
jgi:hypothetical protein